MAMGPMKKRMVLSFTIGFLIMLVISIAGAVIFYKMYANVKQELASATQHFTYVYVAKEDFYANGVTELTIDSFEQKQIVTSTLPNEYYTQIKDSSEDSFEKAQTNSLDAHCLLWPNAKIKVYPKIDIPKGTIITMDMLWDSTEKVTSDVREQEFNMIVLPSLLKEGDYVDVRLLLPTGNDFVVAAFKRVKKITEGTVWFDLKEKDTQYISCAIIEAALTRGAMLYAVKYSEPTLQDKTKITYAPLQDVYDLLINEKYSPLETTEITELTYSWEAMRDIIKKNIVNYQETDSEEAKKLIEEKIQERIEKQQEERANQIANGSLIGDSTNNTAE